MNRPSAFANYDTDNEVEKDLNKVLSSGLEEAEGIYQTITENSKEDDDFAKGISEHKSESKESNLN